MSNSSAHKIILLQNDPNALDTVANWIDDEFGHLEPTQSLDQLKQKLQKIINSGGPYMICVSSLEETITGTASIIIDDGLMQYKTFSPWLANLYVSPEYRKRGFGESLIKFCIQYAKKQGFKKLYLYTEKHEESFVKLGWDLLDRTEHANRKVSVMVLDLLSK